MLGLTNSVTNYYFVPRADTVRATCLSNPVHIYFSLTDFTRIIAHYFSDACISGLCRIYVHVPFPVFGHSSWVICISYYIYFSLL